MSKVKYIGQKEEYTDILTKEDIVLSPGEYYDIDISLDGPQMIVNGQQMIHPDSTVWIHVGDKISIPYAPSLVSNFWEGLSF